MPLFKQMAFIIPVSGQGIISSALKQPSQVAVVSWRAPMIVARQVSPHPGYDVAAVSTYIAYFMARYWGGEDRKDAELFGVVMGLWWQWTHDHDAMIFLLLWLLGGASHFIAGSFLAGGNREASANFWLGVKTGGYMSYLLVCFDLLGLFSGY